MTTRLAEEVWRDFVVDGVPASGNHKPQKTHVRLWGSEIEALLGSVITGGGFMYATKAALDADLAKAAGSGAWVYADTTAANNGIYRKVGNSGTGSWTRATDLPFSVIGLTVTGGTANAIQAASALPVPQAARSALFILVPNAANTGAVTLEINGSTAKGLKWQAGENLASGHLTANVPVLFFDNGAEYRLTQDDSLAGFVASAQAAAAAAAASESAAGTHAANAAQSAIDAELSEDAADLSATAAGAHAAASQAARIGSETARDQAVAAASASGNVVFFNTYAAAVAGIGPLSINQVVHVFDDETRQNRRTAYRKIAGPAYEFLVVLDDSAVSSAPGYGGRIALMFDDGYLSNYTVARDVLSKYGFAATLAVEVDMISQLYAGTIPMCRPEHLRELVWSGWELGNHPILNLAWSEATMYSNAKANNDLLRDLLSGAKIKNPTTFAITTGPNDYPEFNNYPIQTVVYQGGARNNTSDLAYRCLYDRIRSINGTVTDRGDWLYSTTDDLEMPMQMSAIVADTSVGASVMRNVKGFIAAVAQSKGTGILYGHHTPEVGAETSSPPSINRVQLEEICQWAVAHSVAIVPLGSIWKGNANYDKDHALSSGSFAAGAGDTAAYDASDVLNGLSRSVLLTTTAHRGNFSTTSYSTPVFTVRPFTRYRARIRYKIDTDLTVNGGPANRNHGLTVQLRSAQANTAGYAAGNSTSTDEILNDFNAVKRAPYQATSGWSELTYVLTSDFGTQAQLQIGILQCIGTVRIGLITLERFESLNLLPLTVESRFNTSTGRLVYLPVENTANGRRWRWQVAVEYDARKIQTTTYNFAFSNSADVPSPVNGSTCYVIGIGAGAFAGQSGKLATYDGTNWSFTTIARGTFFQVTTNAEGIANRFFVHLGSSAAKGALYVEYGAPVIDDVIVEKVGNSLYRVWDKHQSRTSSDVFRLVARPIMEVV